ncbi:MAG: IS1595 family transposase, partial [Candidatus Sedimenticola endophacoides]
RRATLRLGRCRPAGNGVFAKYARFLIANYTEFSYRFNRRFTLESMLPRLGFAAVRTPPMPFRLLSIAESH